jgi:hypothetical protein
MAWLPFPFPKCPACGRQWAYSYHYQCPGRGQVEVDPDARKVRCQHCRESWHVYDNRFICACGDQFSATDVQSAIDDIIATTKLFSRILEDNMRTARRAHELGESSLREWVSVVAEGIGGHLGGLLGKIAGTLARFLFGK